MLQTVRDYQKRFRKWFCFFHYLPICQIQLAWMVNHTVQRVYILLNLALNSAYNSVLWNVQGIARFKIFFSLLSFLGTTFLVKIWLKYFQQSHPLPVPESSAVPTSPNRKAVLVKDLGHTLYRNLLQRSYRLTHCIQFYASLWIGARKSVPWNTWFLILLWALFLLTGPYDKASS